ncbi:MAG: oligosaccharide repeat unit polymerase [Rhizobium sp.]|nr:oligosaccharide repeat unit polymerase [Rhizobium sp.]MDM8013343.1 oligosaccharide repeat unit polymerase [Rhizobium sp.]
MLIHPGILMLLVWLSASISFFALPYTLTFRSLDAEALLILFLYLFSFCFSAFLAAPLRSPNSEKLVRIISYGSARSLLALASLFSISMFILDMLQRGAFDLGALADYRTMQAQALLHGEASSSSIFFKLAFLTYPASYSYIAMMIIVSPRIPFLKIGVLGIAPAILAAFLMGGRTPILCAIFISSVSLYIRLNYANSLLDPAERKDLLTPRRKFTFIVLVALAFIYFCQVFILRADSVGGTDAMFRLTGSIWGVMFDGPAADALVSLIGAKATYLLLVFSWYFNQGVLISNDVFASYGGDYLWGAYGIDLVSAVVRRVDPVWLSDGFDELLSLQVYGFFPSAFGSLFVDFGFYGLIVTSIWGWLSGFVYLKVQSSSDIRYLVVFAFVIMGVIFSLINTPLGFGNGLMIHIWLFLSCSLIRVQPEAATFDRDRPGGVAP